MAERRSLDRLPKWAKDEIERLEASVGYYKRELQVKLAPEQTTVSIRDYSLEGGERYLPKDTTVRFALKSGGHIEVRGFANYVQVRSDGMSRESQALLVQPAVSNEVRITAGEWM